MLIINNWGLFVYDNRKWEITLIYAEPGSLQNLKRREKIYKYGILAYNAR